MTKHARATLLLAAAHVVVILIAVATAAPLGDNAADSPASAPSVSLADLVAERFAAGLRKGRYSFLNDAEIGSVQTKVRDFAARYEPAGWTALQREVLLDSIDRYVPAYFHDENTTDPDGLDRGYIEFPDQVMTFEWKLWLALTRAPFTSGDATRRDAQRDWMRDLIHAAAEAPIALRAAMKQPGDLRAEAIAQLQTFFADPLSLLYAPMSDAQFETFKEHAGKQEPRAQSIGQPGFWVSTFLSSALSTLVPWRPDPSMPEGAAFDVALPFDDKVTQVYTSGYETCLAFASNAVFRGRGDLLHTENGKPGRVLDVAANRPFDFWVRGDHAKNIWPRELMDEEPAGPNWARWLNARGIGDFCYYGAKDCLLAARGAKLVRLKAANWPEADRTSDDSLRALLSNEGADTLSTASIAEWPYRKGGDIAFFVAVETREKRLAVVGLSQISHGIWVYATVRVRPKPSDTALENAANAAFEAANAAFEAAAADGQPKPMAPEEMREFDRKHHAKYLMTPAEIEAADTIDLWRKVQLPLRSSIGA